MSLDLIWTRGILRPGGCLELYVTFLRLFLSRFCGVAAHIVPLGEQCRLGVLLPWGVIVFNCQFNVVADGCRSIICNASRIFHRICSPPFHVSSSYHSGSSRCLWRISLKRLFLVTFKSAVGQTLAERCVQTKRGSHHTQKAFFLPPLIQKNDLTCDSKPPELWHLWPSALTDCTQQGESYWIWRLKPAQEKSD